MAVFVSATRRNSSVRRNDETAPDSVLLHHEVPMYRFLCFGVFHSLANCSTCRCEEQGWVSYPRRYRTARTAEALLVTSAIFGRGTGAASFRENETQGIAYRYPVARRNS